MMKRMKMMRRIRKKLLTFVICCALVLSNLSVTGIFASAEELGESTEEVTEEVIEEVTEEASAGSYDTEESIDTVAEESVEEGLNDSLSEDTESEVISENTEDVTVDVSVDESEKTSESVGEEEYEDIVYEEETSVNSSIDMEKIKNVADTFSALLNDYFDNIVSKELSSEETYTIIRNTIAEMDEEKLNDCIDRSMEAMDAFDSLSFEEADYFSKNEAYLYISVMESLSEVLSIIMMNDVAPMSLLPLEEVYANIILSSYSKEQLKSFSIKDFLSLLKDSEGAPIVIDKNATTAWMYIEDTDSGVEDYVEYSIIDDDKIDLSQKDDASVVQLEMIIGKDGQLNDNNKRYLISVYLKDEFSSEFSIELFVESEDGSRREVIPDNCNSWISTFTSGGEVLEELNFDVSYASSLANSLGDEGKVLLNIKSDVVNNPRVSIDIYPVLIIDNAYITIMLPITDMIFNQDMTKSGSGYEISGQRNTDTTFKVITRVDGEDYKEQFFCVRYWNWYPAHTGTMYSVEDGIKTDVFTSMESSFDYKTHISKLNHIRVHSPQLAV